MGPSEVVEVTESRVDAVTSLVSVVTSVVEWFRDTSPVGVSIGPEGEGDRRLASAGCSLQLVPSSSPSF